MQYPKGRTDDYITPLYAWEQIKQFIPVTNALGAPTVIWEPFYCDGSSGDNLRSLGFEVIHTDEDFFKSNHGDVIVTNPPFSIKQAVLKRLKKLGKPFILLMPSYVLSSVYWRETVGVSVQFLLLIPPRRIEFLTRGEGVLKPVGRPSFDCFYYCVGLSKSGVIFL